MPLTQIILKDKYGQMQRGQMRHKNEEQAMKYINNLPANVTAVYENKLKRQGSYTLSEIYKTFPFLIARYLLEIYKKSEGDSRIRCVRNESLEGDQLLKSVSLSHHIVRDLIVINGVVIQWGVFSRSDLDLIEHGQFSACRN